MQVEQGPLASIVIVNWNGLRWLRQLLPSLREQSFRDFEIVVVDNGSADGSLEFLRQAHPEVRTVPLKENTGFAAGSNAGIRASRGKYVVLLNNDTRPERGWLGELVRAAEADASVGMCAPLILDADRVDLLDSAGIAVAWDGFSRQMRHGEPAPDDLPAQECLAPSGCSGLYRREMLDQVGLLDEDFFCYCEDTDLGLRGRFAGWKCMLLPRRARASLLFAVRRARAGEENFLGRAQPLLRGDQELPLVPRPAAAGDFALAPGRATVRDAPRPRARQSAARRPLRRRGAAGVRRGVPVAARAAPAHVPEAAPPEVHPQVDRAAMLPVDPHVPSQRVGHRLQLSLLGAADGLTGAASNLRFQRRIRLLRGFFPGEVACAAPSGAGEILSTAGVLEKGDEGVGDGLRGLRDRRTRRPRPRLRGKRGCPSTPRARRRPSPRSAAGRSPHRVKAARRLPRIDRAPGAPRMEFPEGGRRAPGA